MNQQGDWDKKYEWAAAKKSAGEKKTWWNKRNMCF